MITTIKNQASEIIQNFAKSNKKIATVESCTGGLVAKMLTDIAGSSDWFECSWITYSNNSKSKLVGVSTESIKTYGAVSREVAEEMSEGGFGLCSADIVLSITGVAGPEGGTAINPVGKVWISWTTAKETQSKSFTFNGNREEIRYKSALECFRIIENSFLELIKN